ncbi:MAG: hypothetical protein M3O22_02910 [Pseudomonadota bacterium]|nr:hypothetical protein [Pseudomonadota bacterium]
MEPARQAGLVFGMINTHFDPESPVPGTFLNYLRPESQDFTAFAKALIAFTETQTGFRKACEVIPFTKLQETFLDCAMAFLRGTVYLSIHDSRQLDIYLPPDKAPDLKKLASFVDMLESPDNPIPTPGIEQEIPALRRALRALGKAHAAYHRSALGQAGHPVPASLLDPLKGSTITRNMIGNFAEGLEKFRRDILEFKLQSLEKDFAFGTLKTLFLETAKEYLAQENPVREQGQAIALIANLPALRQYVTAPVEGDPGYQGQEQDRRLVRAGLDAIEYAAQAYGPADLVPSQLAIHLMEKAYLHTLNTPVVLDTGLANFASELQAVAAPDVQAIEAGTNAAGRRVWSVPAAA